MPRVADAPARQAARFHALADETRLQILALLRGGEHCVCELTEALEIGQSLLSFHLRTLREAGLVTDRRQGRWTYYALNQPEFASLAATLTTLTAPRSSRPRRCEP
jgi:ArsR family transcriptional regulator